MKKVEFSQEVSDIALRAMIRTYSEGYKESNKDLKQMVEGQQARINWMNASSKQTEVMASADHSKIEQIDKACQDTVNVVNNNSLMMKKVIKQMREPREIDGSELLQAIEQEAGSTMSKLIQRQVVQYINSSVDEIQNEKQAIKKERLAIARLCNNLVDGFKQFVIIMLIILTGFSLVTIVPWWPLKVVLGMATLIGGVIYYGKN